MSAARREGVAEGMPLMKFRLTWDGELPSTGNASKKPEKKWQIRKEVSPQLKELWASHPTLMRALSGRVITADHQKTNPGATTFIVPERHHSVAITPNFRPVVRDGQIDLCAPITRKHHLSGDQVSFVPLVRDTLALKCSLSILFLRREPAGSVYSRHKGGGGGDLDNRIKTVLDAMSIPESDQISEGSIEPMYCLLESDSLVSGLHIETDRLLARPGHAETEVRLVIDVDVRVTDARYYNSFFLGG